MKFLVSIILLLICASLFSYDFVTYEPNKQTYSGELSGKSNYYYYVMNSNKVLSIIKIRDVQYIYLGNLDMTSNVKNKMNFVDDAVKPYFEAIEGTNFANTNARPPIVATQQIDTKQKDYTKELESIHGSLKSISTVLWLELSLSILAGIILAAQ